MKYFSTNRQSAHVSFRQAVLNGQPPDKGLYFPEKILMLPADFWKNFPDQSKERIAFEIIKPYVSDVGPEPEIPPPSAPVFKLAIFNSSNFGISFFRTGSTIKSSSERAINS